MNDGKMELSVLPPDQEDKAGDEKKESEERIEPRRGERKTTNWCCW